MVIGLDIFRKYFEPFPGNYIIIGGTACDIIIDEAGFTPRATKDIDIILVVEALSAEFVKQFWQFINDGKYERNEKSADDRKYYRFANPADTSFPKQIELFSRKPDLVDLEEPAHLTPIPADDDLSSLSAILMDKDYYSFLTDHSTLNDGLHLANIEALICLKAMAFLDISERIAKGGTVDSRHLRKHKNDVFRLAGMLPEGTVFELPGSIQDNMQAFVDAISGDLPDQTIFKEMGLGRIEPKKVFSQLVKSFKLTLR
ncbi:MAG: hypothetical protein D4R64_12575 [Porphyromonadaceae bacterium]|nr:MAG: hypothetical protein D4R64_12575 [Porphyromonadaceae bacterium]